MLKRNMAYKKPQRGISTYLRRRCGKMVKLENSHNICSLAVCFCYDLCEELDYLMGSRRYLTFDEYRFLKHTTTNGTLEGLNILYVQK